LSVRSQVPRLETGPCAVAAIEAWLATYERLATYDKKKGPLFVAFHRTANCAKHGSRDGSWPKW
jgi:hypothetical protein